MRVGFHYNNFLRQTTIHRLVLLRMQRFYWLFTNLRRSLADVSTESNAVMSAAVPYSNQFGKNLYLAIIRQSGSAVWILANTDQ